MAHIDVSLPDALCHFAEVQVSDGRFATVSDYVSELIRADAKRRAEAQLEMLLLEGLEGDETAMDAEDWIAIRRDGLAEAGKSRANRA